MPDDSGSVTPKTLETTIQIIGPPNGGSVTLTNIEDGTVSDWDGQRWIPRVSNEAPQYYPKITEKN